MLKFNFETDYSSLLSEQQAWQEFLSILYLRGNEIKNFQTPRRFKIKTLKGDYFNLMYQYRTSSIDTPVVGIDYILCYINDCPNYSIIHSAARPKIILLSRYQTNYEYAMCKSQKGNENNLQSPSFVNLKHLVSQNLKTKKFRSEVIQEVKRLTLKYYGSNEPINMPMLPTFIYSYLDKYTYETSNKFFGDDCTFENVVKHIMMKIKEKYEFDTY